VPVRAQVQVQVQVQVQAQAQAQVQVQVQVRVRVRAPVKARVQAQPGRAAWARSGREGAPAPARGLESDRRAEDPVSCRAAAASRCPPPLHPLRRATGYPPR
jgi:hypothetical protein